jgi:multidrug efflux pump subunit AcrA (membrane-fusion protein)
VSERGQLQTIYIAAEGTARARMVTLGERNGDHVEVLSGLSSGETLIYPVPPGLTEGAAIVAAATSGSEVRK